MRFEAGETVILEQVVVDAKTSAPRNVDALIVDITDPDGVSVVTAGSMTNDSVGNYHYDYTLPDLAPLGIYEVVYEAVSGSRTTRQRDSFEVHS